MWYSLVISTPDTDTFHQRDWDEIVNWISVLMMNREFVFYPVHSGNPSETLLIYSERCRAAGNINNIAGK